MLVKLKISDLIGALTAPEIRASVRGSFNASSYWPPAERFAKINFGYTEKEIFIPAANDDDILSDYEKERLTFLALGNLISTSLTKDVEIISFLNRINIDPLDDEGNLHPYAKANVRLLEAMSLGWCPLATNPKVREWQISQRNLILTHDNDYYEIYDVQAI